MFARRARPPQRGRPTRTTQILKDKNACRTPCPAPVWWFERCAQNPIPSRTRPLNAPAPMVLCLKTRESRSPPDLHRTRKIIPSQTITGGAGWSSPVARQAHNLKVVGSNPTPAPNLAGARGRAGRSLIGNATNRAPRGPRAGAGTCVFRGCSGFDPRLECAAALRERRSPVNPPSKQQTATSKRCLWQPKCSHVCPPTPARRSERRQQA
jgi:hypothetical protein